MALGLHKQAISKVSEVLFLVSLIDNRLWCFYNNLFCVAPNIPTHIVKLKIVKNLFILPWIEFILLFYFINVSFY